MIVRLHSSHVSFMTPRRAPCGLTGGNAKYMVMIQRVVNIVKDPRRAGRKNLPRFYAKGLRRGGKRGMIEAKDVIK